MLIIEIALGILLGWLLINHFSTLIDTFAGFIDIVLKVIFLPFKLIFKYGAFSIKYFTDNFLRIVKIFSILCVALVSIFFINEFRKTAIELISKSWHFDPVIFVVVGIIIAAALYTVIDLFVYALKKFKSNKNS